MKFHEMGIHIKIISTDDYEKKAYFDFYDIGWRLGVLSFNESGSLCQCGTLP